MARPRERRWPRVAAGYVTLVVLLGVTASPIAFAVDAAHRPLVVRIAGSVLLGVAALHVTRSLRRRLEAQPLSDFEEVLRAPAPETSLDARFVDLREEVAAAAGSANYFERVLWPRVLEAVGGASGGRTRPLPRRPGPRLFRRGPSPRALERLIAAVEEARE
ncbi:MAG TPA: hypothetical protein VEL75_23190 [Candidatus Methylomirabilis sp.]|nr:hypothetical protein [Candidatus Methylomirabilis sp.]